MQSRVPALDALSFFAPNGAALPAEADHAVRKNLSRWYPVEGGHRVLVLYEGGWPFDGAFFTLEPKVWDHDHCAACATTIEAMTLCWVTRSGEYVVLCVDCKTQMDGGGPAVA